MTKTEKETNRGINFSLACLAESQGQPVTSGAYGKPAENVFLIGANLEPTKEQCPPALRLTVIPFAGFYESIFSELAESSLSFITDSADNLTKDECGELATLVYGVQDFSALRHDIAKAYAESFSEWFKEETGFDLGLQFESMTSPREYNFQTDRIFCFIDPAKVKELYRKETDKDIFAALIKERFTSRDGFASFYSNDLVQWLIEGKPESWDHNQVETLILAKMRQHGIEADSLYGFDSPLFERLQDLQGNGRFDCLSSEYTAATANPESVARMNALLDKECGRDQEQPKQEESENV